MPRDDLEYFAVRHGLDDRALAELRALIADPWGRYVDLGLIDEGGMGQIRRVHDRHLGRVVAMKVLHGELSSDRLLRDRFVQEAQALAQLAHPGIVPIHDFGELTDGRCWFTMPVVRGETLRRRISAVHGAAVHGSAVHGAAVHAGGSGAPTVRSLLEVFVKMCDAVGFAHAQGVIHRDLKPSNVMLGPWGEVLVLDWGLAKVLDQSEPPVRTSRSVGDAVQTAVGTVAGTPAYMAPEQARGDTDRIDTRTDVYALGAILYEMLTGRPPYDGEPNQVLQQVLAGQPPVLARAEHTLIGLTTDREDPARADAPPTLPPVLADACERALALDPDDRYPEAGPLGRVIADWLAGARRRDEALAVVRAAEAHVPAADELRQRASRLEQQAHTLLAAIPPWGPEEAKLRPWSLLEAAEASRQQAEMRELAAEQALQGALAHDPDLPEAHAVLAARRRDQLEAAEARGDATAATRAEVQVRAHLAALPAGHPDRLRHQVWLRGDGALTLVTDPPGAEVVLHRFAPRGRRLVPRPVRVLGRTPLFEVPIPRGSWLLVLRSPGRVEVALPIHLTRLEHHDGAPPGSSDPHPIWLPPLDALGSDDVYVPAGWFRAGPRGERQLWCDGFVVKRFPVQRLAWLAFVEDVAARQGAEVARALGGAGPDEPTGTLEWPVADLDHAAASRFARWIAERSGLPWRLPSEWEWEKAARGVDGRAWPWGNHHDYAWCRNRHSQPGRRGPAPVGMHPVDCGPYGGRDLAGGVREWCLEPAHERPPPTGSRVVPVAGQGAAFAARGGSWDDEASGSRCARRVHVPVEAREPWLGLRLARSLPDPA